MTTLQSSIVAVLALAVVFLGCRRETTQPPAWADAVGAACDRVAADLRSTVELDSAAQFTSSMMSRGHASTVEATLISLCGTVRDAPERHADLEEQVERYQALADEARALQSAVPRGEPLTGADLEDHAEELREILGEMAAAAEAINRHPLVR